MPDSSGTFAITVPCESELVTLAALQEYSYDLEAAIAAVDVAGEKARKRPAAAVRGVTAYTAGVAVLQSFSTVASNNDNMFNPATPTVLTVQTAGSYLITANCSTNMISTNTSHKGEILINGVLATQTKSGAGLTANQPPNPLTVAAFAPNLVVGNTISLRITVTGVGNDSTFSQLYACLISYGV